MTAMVPAKPSPRIGVRFDIPGVEVTAGPGTYAGAVSDHASRPLPVHALRTRQLLAVDCLVALGVTVLFIAIAATDAATGDGEPVPLWAQCLVAAGVGAPIAVRRRWPVPIFAVVLVMSVLSLLLDVVREPFVVAAYALYQVAVTTPRPRWLSPPALGLASAVGLAVLVLIGSPRGVPDWWRGPGMVLLGVAVMAGAWALGQNVRERRSYAARYAERLAEHAVTEERLRIARELHDVVAHSMGVIAVKAAVANHVWQQRPAEAQRALRVIESTSRDALTELRRMLGVLRATDEPREPAAALDPAPGLAGLPELTSRVALAGVSVELDLHGSTRLPPGVEMSTYRIVQEALTNVVKHAAPTRCRVGVRVAEREVRIEVTDEGPAQPAARPPELVDGHGLIGMRERVAMYGGELSAAPRAGGGFRVSARLPYEPAQAVDQDQAS
jgi:signal transduction histidine kinase